MKPNIIVIVACALIPFLIAYGWFHPKVFGGETWKKVANLTEAQNNKKIKWWQLLVSILLNFFISFGVFVVTVHGTHIISLHGGDAEAALNSATTVAFLKEHGGNYASLSHGIPHGLLLACMTFVVPILGYAVIFERKSFKYLLVNGGFWALSLTIMACIISRWGGIPIVM